MSIKAIKALYPTVTKTVDDQAYDANGNEVTLDWTAINNWQDPDQYKLDRQKAYPQISDQLDMLWHSIDSGTLNKTSDFYTTLKQVKDDNPKPTE
jgi:hypothetical protein